MDDQQIQQMLVQMSSDIATLKSEVKSTWKRIDEQHSLVDTVHKLALSIEKQSGSLEKQSAVLERHTEALAALQRDVDELKAKPAKRLDGIVTTAIAVVITAIVTFVISKTGLK